MRFEIFKSGSGSFVFELLDGTSTVLTSPSYDSVENAVEGVKNLIQAAANSGNYVAGTNAFTIESAGKTLATSSNYGSGDAISEAIKTLSGDVFQDTDFEVTYTETRNENQKLGFEVDVNAYDFTKTSVSGKSGFEEILSNDKNHFFHFNNANGQAIVFSQPYASAASRNSGIRSVIQNAAKDERCIVIEEGGKYYFIIKAQTGRELVRSLNFDSQAAAQSALDYVRANAGAFADAYPKPEKKYTRDTNQNTDSYRFEVASKSGVGGFESFQQDDNKLSYFHYNDASGSAILYSQGYQGANGRDNGIRSVIKNAPLDDRYTVAEESGKHYFILKAGNKQEIARSCMFNSLDELNTAKSYMLENAISYATQYGLDPTTIVKTETFNIKIDKPAESVAAAVAPAAVAASTDADDDDDRLEDDYLVCGEYRDRVEDSKSEKYPGFITFQHENGKHYFALLGQDGDLYLRSEGYPTTAARDNGIESVMKNIEIEGRHSIEEKRGLFFLILKAGNHQEIARSCPYTSLAHLEGRKGKSYLAAAGLAATGLGAAALVANASNDATPKTVVEEPKPTTATTTNKEEKDSSTAAALAGAGAIAAAATAAAASSKDNIEAAATTAKDKGSSTVAAALAGAGAIAAAAGAAAAASSKDNIEAAATTAKDKGSSTAAALAGAGAIAAAGAAVASDKGKAAAASIINDETNDEAAAAGGGWGRWLPWLLGALLLAGLLWWLLRGCSSESNSATPAESGIVADTVQNDTTTTAATTTNSDTTQQTAAATTATQAVCNCSGNEEPIFNIPTGVTPKKLARLGTNPEFARYTKLHGKTPAEFFTFLKERYNKSAVDKAFLDRLTKAMGYANGFADVTEAAISEHTFPIGTVGNLGWGANHNTAYDQLPDNETDRLAFKINGNGGCDIYFMKTCGNHMFPDSNCK